MRQVQLNKNAKIEEETMLTCRKEVLRGKRGRQLLGADLEADVCSSQHLWFLTVSCLLQRQRNTPQGWQNVAAVKYFNIAYDALASVL